MKLKLALKKFKFLGKQDYDNEVVQRLGDSLKSLLKGDDNVQLTPLGESIDTDQLLKEWGEVFVSNSDLMNEALLKLEGSSARKFGPRSRSLPWAERKKGIYSSWSNQDLNYVPVFKKLEGPGYLLPISMEEAATKMKLNSSAGLPFAMKKFKCIDFLLKNFDKYRARKDACMLFTRTGENWKTRNIWGYPFADTLYEMMFYVPLMLHQRTLSWRASLVGPEAVARKATEIVDHCMHTGRLGLSIDFEGFDTRVKFQYIIQAFIYFGTCFVEGMLKFLLEICLRFYTIPLLTPEEVKKGPHGIPSGSTFTNEVGSVIQAMKAFIHAFINPFYVLIQGDDGVYAMFENEIKTFIAGFTAAGMKVEESKSDIASNYVVFCQNLYHDEFRDDDGIILPIYPTYRALTRLIFPESFADFETYGIKGSDYYGIRTIAILENCKNHPLFEQLVRFVLAREKKYSLSFTDDGLIAYCNLLAKGAEATTPGQNYQYSSNVSGIKQFATYKLIQSILAEETPDVPA